MPVHHRTTTHLCEVFRYLAARTWRDLGDAFRAGHSLGEEAITDYLLLDLKRSAPTEIVVNKFNRRDEGRTTGADWEWWFVQGGRGFGMRVQAKRLNPATQSYDTLDHVVRRTRRKQINLLIGDARSASPPLYPVYCFYNHVPPRRAVGCWHCAPGASNVSEFGCSIASAHSIRALLGRRRKRTDLETIGALSFPWACLVCCKGLVSNRASLPDRVRAVASAVSERVPNAEFDGDPPRPRRRRAVVPEIVAELPAYVRDAIEARDGDRRPDAEGEPPEPLRTRPVDGLLVVHAADER